MTFWKYKRTTIQQFDLFFYNWQLSNMSNTISIITWNVNGIRAIVKKSFEENVREMNPDILMLQETKATKEEVLSTLANLSDFYEIHVNESKTRKGYSGTAILSKKPVYSVVADMNMEEHDQEGRVLTAEFDSFFLVNVYTPNSGQGLKRLDYRASWDRDFLKYLRGLKDKPVLVGGDLNVAHQPIDLSRPKANYNKTSGYTQVEIDGFSTFLKAGYQDVFRTKYPDEQQFTYWNYMFNARAKNIGWRIDYFLASAPLMDNVQDIVIHKNYLGSDHCPVEVKLGIV